ncbi:MAG TPA: ParA family protein, partial [Anaerolineales bacterium]
ILFDALRKDSSLAAYDTILLDCPPSLGAVTLNALIGAHFLIIPTQAEFFSLNALRAMLGSVRQVRSKQNPGLAYRILITMIDRRNRIHRNLSEQIRATFGAGLFNTTIETDTKLRETSAAGLPITHYIPNSRSALQYDALAEELIQHAPKSAKH